MNVKNLIRALVVAVVILSMATSCRHRKFSLRVESVNVELNEMGMIPQAGTTIEIYMACDEDELPATKAVDIWYPLKKYRYRVFLDGELYSYGICGDMGPHYNNILIPIIANESYRPKSILVEGAKATAYNSDIYWNKWETLFEGTQDCHGEGEPLRYTGLENKRLKVNIDGSVLYYQLNSGFSAEAFKRIMSDVGELECECSLTGHDISSKNSDELIELFSGIPHNEVVGIREGAFGAKDFLGYSNSLIFSAQDSWEGYITPIGMIIDESKPALHSLAERGSQSKKIIWTTMSLSLCD